METRNKSMIILLLTITLFMSLFVIHRNIILRLETLLERSKVSNCIFLNDTSEAVTACLNDE